MPRTTITIPIQNIDSANAVLQNYFAQNEYEVINVNGEVLMKKSIMPGLAEPWFIAARFDTSFLVVECFMGKPHKREKDLTGMYALLVKEQAQKVLKEIEQLVTYSQFYNPQSPEVSNPVNAEAFVPAYAPQAGKMSEKKAKWAYVSIIIGVIAIIGALSNVFFLGVIVIIIGIIFGANSLKTSKRGFAIAGIVLNCISVPIMVLTFLSMLW